MLTHLPIWGSSTKLTLDFARLSLISLREGHYFKRISARVSPNAIQCLNIAGWSWKVSITWITAPPVFLTSKRPIESGIRLHRITLALIWWSPTNRGSGRSRQNRASVVFLFPAWTPTQIPRQIELPMSKGHQPLFLTFNFSHYIVKQAHLRLLNVHFMNTIHLMNKRWKRVREVRIPSGYNCTVLGSE